MQYLFLFIVAAVLMALGVIFGQNVAYILGIIAFALIILGFSKEHKISAQLFSIFFLAWCTFSLAYYLGRFDGTKETLRGKPQWKMNVVYQINKDSVLTPVDTTYIKIN